MNANAVPLLAIFEKKVRLEVPLFQRQYVWNREHQWQPLWEDFARKFTEHLDGRTDAPVHFLGAMVLDQKQTPTTHVERRQIIDGQQRLTTLQLFLTAFRDFCREQECADLAKECETFTLNTGMMANPAVDKFKVWPTQADRKQFTEVLDAGSKAAVEKAYPLRKKKFARKYDPRPSMVEAYLYFADELIEFFVGNGTEPPLCADAPLAQRLETCFTALKNSLRVVVIDLDKEDDAQVIFETLNARGEPLLPADLLRNYIFLRAGREGTDQEALYAQYWQPFDEPFWRQEVRQGRLNRPRSDLFIQHFLASKQTYDIPIRHLYVEYKYWIERVRPFASMTDELAAIARQGNDFRRIIQPKKDDPIHHLARFLASFDISTAYPFVLHLLDTNPSARDCKEYTDILESYLLRRAVCGLTTKNYNRIFLTMTRALRKDGTSPTSLRQHLLGLTGDSTGWPADDQFANAWNNTHAYSVLNNPKMVYVLRCLNDTYLTNKHESLTIDGDLTVEHILPQKWTDNWTLPDGTKGLTVLELNTTPADDRSVLLTRSRDRVLQTFGNLTILTQPLNSSLSNAAWTTKKPALLKASLLPINQELHDYNSWDESTIANRGQELLKRALHIWPRTT
jgi:uncharacterized protein with ParB-like and HNH nuclease domain